MPFELYYRVCVGAPLKPHAATRVMEEFYTSLGLPTVPDPVAVFDRLREDVPKHKRHEPDRMRFERALETFIDERWNVDFAIGGVSPDGLVNLTRGFLFIGVRMEQFDKVVPEPPRKAEVPEKPQWLRKGDLSPGSEMYHNLGEDVRKEFDHACRMYARASKEILKDATFRLKELPVIRQHDPDFALCRWLVDTTHFSVQHRHGGRVIETG